MLAEIQAGLSGARIQCDQAGIEGAAEDAFAAMFSLVSPLPVGDAATGRGVDAGQVHLRVVHPALLPGFRVQGDNPVERSAQEHGVVDHQGGGLERRGAVSFSAGRNVSGVIGPGDFKAVDVIRSDLVKRCKALRCGTAADCRPVCYRAAVVNPVTAARYQGKYGAARHREMESVHVFRPNHM